MDHLWEDLLEEGEGGNEDLRFAGVEETTEVLFDAPPHPDPPAVKAELIPSPHASPSHFPSTNAPEEVQEAAQFPSGWTSEDLELIFPTPAGRAVPLTPQVPQPLAQEVLVVALGFTIVCVLGVAWWYFSPAPAPTHTQQRGQAALDQAAKAIQAARGLGEADVLTTSPALRSALLLLREAQVALEVQARSPAFAQEAAGALQQVQRAQVDVEDRCVRAGQRSPGAPRPDPPLEACSTGADPGADVRLLARVDSSESLGNPLAIVGLQGTRPASPSLTMATSFAGLPQVVAPDEVQEVPRGSTPTGAELRLRRAHSGPASALSALPPPPALALSFSEGGPGSALGADLAAVAQFAAAGGMDGREVHAIVANALAGVVASHHAASSSLAHMTALQEAAAADAQRRHAEALNMTRTLGQEAASSARSLQQTVRAAAEEQVALQVASVVADHSAQAAHLHSARLSTALSLSWLCLAVAVVGAGFLTVAQTWVAPCLCTGAPPAWISTLTGGVLGWMDSYCGANTLWLRPTCLLPALAACLLLLLLAPLAACLPGWLARGGLYVGMTLAILAPTARVALQHWGTVALVALSPLVSLGTLAILVPYTVPSPQVVHGVLVQHSDPTKRQGVLDPGQTLRNVQGRSWGPQWALTIAHVVFATVAAALLQCAAKQLDTVGMPSVLSDGWLPVGSARCAANTLMHLLHEGMVLISN